MAENMVISSVQNVRVKRVVELQQKSAARRESGFTVVEGVREITHCLEAGFVIEEVYYCNSMVDIALMGLKDCPKYEVTRDVYEKMAYRGSTEGVIAVVKVKDLQFNDLQLGENPLVVVLESVEKPGNLGAVLRSADAARVDAVVVCDPRCDIYNPNVIRSSIGAVFIVPCVAASSIECIEFFKKHNIQILTAQLQDSRPYYDVNMCCGTAIVMGTESTGLTDVWREVADSHILIPMGGKLDSLNVSVSAAILMFEAVRQRGQ